MSLYHEFGASQSLLYSFITPIKVLLFILRLLQFTYKVATMQKYIFSNHYNFIDNLCKIFAISNEWLHLFSNSIFYETVEKCYIQVVTKFKQSYNKV